jgi:hypothetical protein
MVLRLLLALQHQDKRGAWGIAAEQSLLKPRSCKLLSHFGLIYLWVSTILSQIQKEMLLRLLIFEIGTLTHKSLALHMNSNLMGKEPTAVIKPPLMVW